MQQKKQMEELAVYKQTDSLHQGRKQYFMTVDSWIQDGNPSGREDDFGPVMESEAPPTLNGKKME
ncbi:MAG TPA: hypothetical protein VJ824_10445 [Bacillota bacterium]|nr:hypothetical protein [Bacillota bacterium]